MRKELMDYFSDQRWDKLVDDEHIVYRMSESDYLEAISDDAYCYYFPAFLLTTFKQTHQPFSLSKAVELLAKFSRAQLEAFLAFLEYFIVSEREYHEQRQSWTQRPIDDPMLENWEDVQLRIMVRLDDLKDS